MPAFQVGDTICESAPYAFSVADGAVSQVCAQCLSSGNKSIQRCSGCQFLHYCSRDCQIADWVDHKAECANLKRVAPRWPKEPARLMTRILMRWKREIGRPTFESLLGISRQLRECISHKSHIKMDRNRAQGYVEMVSFLRQFLTSSQLGEVNDTDILEIFGIMCINSVHVSNDNGQLGTALYLAPSLIDHSCAPNLSATFNGKKIKLRAIRPIEADSIIDLSLAYIPLHKSKERRRDELKRDYYFTCHCEMCEDEIPEIISEADPKLTDAVLELQKLNLDMSSPENPKKALSELEKLLKEQLSALPETDMAKFTAIMVAADASVCVQDFERANRYYLQSLPILKQVYTENGIHYAYKLVRLARLSTIVTKKTKDPAQIEPLIKLLQEAMRVTKIALGDDHFDTKDVSLLYNELMASLQQQQQHGAGDD